MCHIWWEMRTEKEIKLELKKKIEKTIFKEQYKYKKDVYYRIMYLNTKDWESFWEKELGEK
jgi:hypothetical protein